MAAHLLENVSAASLEAADLSKGASNEEPKGELDWELSLNKGPLGPSEASRGGHRSAPVEA